MHQSNSTTMWSKPATPQQQAYYSKHSPKLKVFAWAVTVKQIAHVLLALGAWTQIYEWATQSVPFLQFLAIPISLLIVYTLHKIFEVTWETFWYDKLDDNDKTDSSIVLPLLILIVLVLSEKQGAQMFLEGKVKPASYKDDKELSQSSSNQIAQEVQLNAAALAAIDAAYKPLLSAKSSKYDSEIAAWQRRPVISDNDAVFIKRNVSAFEKKKQAALAELNAKKAAEIMSQNAAHQDALAKIKARTSTLLARIDDSNADETSRLESDLKAVRVSSWLISLFLVIGIAGLMYAQVAINVNSGILPIREFTDLDAHGSVLSQLAMVIGDIYKRRGVALASWIHEKGSPKSVRTIDGSVKIVEGSYNQAIDMLTKTELTDESSLIGGAYIEFERLLKLFAAATEANESILVWSKIQNLRRNLCSKGFASDLTLENVKIWREDISFNELNKRYPFPPKTVVKPKPAEQTVPQQTSTPPQTESRPVSQAFTNRNHESQAKTIDLLNTVPQQTTVAQPPQTVPQLNATQVVLSEADFLLAFSNLRKWVPNFSNKQARRDNVIANIEKYLTQLRNSDVELSESNATKFTNYLVSTMIPACEAVEYRPDISKWIDYNPKH
jgi:hypothetical protein